MRFLSSVLLISTLLITGDAPAQVLRIYGNERSQSSYLENLVLKCEEDLELNRNEQSYPESLRQCLLNTKLFSDVEIKLTSQVIDIRITDRWTLIPVPMVQTGSGRSSSFGAMIIESNFLGNGLVLGAGAAKSTTGASYLFFLSDPSINFTRWQYQLSARRQSEDLVSYDGKKENDGFNETRTSAATGLGYKLSSNWNFNLGIRRELSKYKQIKAYALPTDYTSAAIYSTLTYNNSSYKLYFQEGLQGKFTYAQQTARSDAQSPMARNYELQLNWQILIQADHALQIFATHGSIRGGNKTDTPRLGSTPGLRGIDRKSAWVDLYCATAVDYQIPVRTSQRGTWTVAPFFDAGLLRHRSDNLRYVRHHAVGLGSYFYLKSVALPGLGLIAGHNINYGRNFVSLSIGASI